MGLENVLAKELIDIGATDIEILKRAVGFKGTNALIYKANYLCRTALRILKPIANFEVNDEDELYEQIGKILWWEYMNVEDTFAVDSVVSYSNLNHSKYVALKTKDAIVDQFRNKYKKRPSIDTENPVLRINIHIFRNNCTVSLDSSGDSLHKRGYRKSGGLAPINEVLSAGLILLSGWKKDCNFIDPMCGSGTILIEAALYANNIPSGYYRKNFAFEKWKDFDKYVWEQIKKEVLLKEDEFKYKIIGTDISKYAIKNAIENIRFAKLHKDIELNSDSIEYFNPPEGQGIMITNPPYGERLNTDNIIELYKLIGDTLKNKYTGYTAWIISGDLNALKFIGLRPSRKIQVYNGKLECKFAKFEIYKGSKKKLLPQS